MKKLAAFKKFLEKNISNSALIELDISRYVAEGAIYDYFESILIEFEELGKDPNEYSLDDYTKEMFKQGVKTDEYDIYVDNIVLKFLRK